MLTQVNTNEVERNTREEVPRRKGLRKRNWFFTLNNWSNEHKNTLISVFEKRGKYLFQEETGANGTKHLQGCIMLNSATTFDALRKCTGIPEIHWEIAQNKFACINYCKKEETRTGGIYTNMARTEKLKDKLSDVEPMKWQKSIIEYVRDGEVDDRKILWLWEAEGNSGKSTLVKHLCIRYGAICCGGRKKDSMYAISEYVKSKKKGPPIVCIDCCRGESVCYNTLECIKNGLFFSSKYESGMCIFNPPHVLVFSNEEPDYDMLSKDRYEVIEVERD